MSETSGSATDLFMEEMAANVEAVLEHALEQIQKPPTGAIADVGHFRVLNGLKKKEMDAVQTLLEEFAYNVAATVLAMLDGAIEGEGVTLPPVEVRLGDETLTGNLHAGFTEAWEVEE